MINILLSNIWNIYGDVFQLTWVYFIIYDMKTLQYNKQKRTNQERVFYKLELLI